MSKELLEEIEEAYHLLHKHIGAYVKWLIKYAKEQAERVQELEEDSRDATFAIDMLESENKRYREALEFYADEENYKPFDGIFLSIYQDNIDEDGGEKARQALKGKE